MLAVYRLVLPWSHLWTQETFRSMQCPHLLSADEEVASYRAHGWWVAEVGSGLRQSAPELLLSGICSLPGFQRSHLPFRLLANCFVPVLTQQRKDLLRWYACHCFSHCFKIFFTLLFIFDNYLGMNELGDQTNPPKKQIRR